MATDQMEAILYRLRSWAKIARSDRGILTFGPDEADAILAALERAERLEKAARDFLQGWIGPAPASVRDYDDPMGALAVRLEDALDGRDAG